MKSLIVITLATAFAAPAFAADGCLFASQVNGFSKATEESVVLSAGAKDYLVTFASPCRDIEDAQGIAAVAATSCFGKGDRVVFTKPGGFQEICFAREVTPLPKAAKPPEKGE